MPGTTAYVAFANKLLDSGGVPMSDRAHPSSTDGAKESDFENGGLSEMERKERKYAVHR